MNNKLLLKIMGCMCFIAIMASCKKITEVQVPAQAQNRILSYKITNVQGNPIEGVVNDDTKTIKVYLPYYYYLTALEPEIKVSEGATVTPATGTIVDDLLDVFDNGRDIKYDITAKDGSKATYTLQLIVQQGNFELGEVSPSATEITELTFSNTNANTPPADLHIPIIGGDIPSGNINLDRQLIKITLIAADGSRVVLDNNAAYKLQVTTNNLDYLLTKGSGEGLKTGLYTIKVRFYSKTVTLKNPVKITVL